MEGQLMTEDSFEVTHNDCPSSFSLSECNFRNVSDYAEQFIHGSLGTTSSDDDYLTKSTASAEINPSLKLWQTILLAIIGGSVCVVTVGGNLIVLLSFVLERSLRQPTHYFIASLAVSDLIIGAISMPIYTLYLLADKQWLLGETVCDLWLSIDYTVCLSSIYTVFCITIDRFCSVKIPTKYRHWKTSQRIVAIVSVTWTIPIFVFFTTIIGWQYFVGIRTVPASQCYVQYMENPMFNCFLQVGYFWITLVVMCVLYSGVYRAALTLQRKSDAKQRKMTSLVSIAGQEISKIGIGMSQCSTGITLQSTKPFDRQMDAKEHVMDFGQQLLSPETDQESCCPNMTARHNTDSFPSNPLTLSSSLSSNKLFNKVLEASEDMSSSPLFASDSTQSPFSFQSRSKSPDCRRYRVQPVDSLNAENKSNDRSDVSLRPATIDSKSNNQSIRVQEQDEKVQNQVGQLGISMVANPVEFNSRRSFQLNNIKPNCIPLSASFNGNPESFPLCDNCSKQQSTDCCNASSAESESLCEDVFEERENKKQEKVFIISDANYSFSGKDSIRKIPDESTMRLAYKVGKKGRYSLDNLSNTHPESIKQNTNRTISRSTALNNHSYSTDNAVNFKSFGNINSIGSNIAFQMTRPTVFQTENKDSVDFQMTRPTILQTENKDSLEKSDTDMDDDVKNVERNVSSPAIRRGVSGVQRTCSEYNDSFRSPDTADTTLSVSCWEKYAPTFEPSTDVTGAAAAASKTGFRRTRDSIMKPDSEKFSMSKRRNCGSGVGGGRSMKDSSGRLAGIKPWRFRNRLMTGSSTTPNSDSNPSGISPQVIGEMFRAENSLLNRQQRQKMSKSSKSENRARKALRTISIILGAFVICWTPWHVLSLVISVYPGSVPALDLLYDVSYWLCYLNSPINPFCYAFVNQQFKKTFIRILKRDWHRT